MGESSRGDLWELQKAAVARVDWRDMRARLENFARALGASSSAAEDAVHTAVQQLFAGATKWDPVRQPDVSRHLLGAVRRTLSNARQSALFRRETPSDRIDGEPAAASDRAAREREALAHAALGRLRRELAGDDLCPAILDLVADGVEKPAAQAAYLGLAKGEIYDARERIARRVRRMAEQAAVIDDAAEVAQ